jgi:hypothetical protein
MISEAILTLKILLWKRWTQLLKSRQEVFGTAFFSVFILIEMHFLNQSNDQQQGGGGLEVIFFPILITFHSQRTIAAIMNEKSAFLLDAMRIAGLDLFSYYTAYLIR